jgi:hypothetical protein
MTRDQAVKLIQALFKSQNAESEGLNENNLGGLSVGDLQIYFEYQPDRGLLNCSALIYRFRQTPKPGVLEGFEQEERSGKTDTGGGRFEYQQENKGVYLSRSYTEPVADSEFISDIENLMLATRTWGGEVLERVASSVFNQE